MTGLLRRSLAAFIVALLLVQPAAAITFELAPGTTKCFTDELSTLYRVVLYYKVSRAYAPFVGVTITQPDSTLLYEQKPGPMPEGQFDFTPTNPGDHALCFISSSKAKKGVSNYEVNFHWLPEYEVDQQKHSDIVLTATIEEKNDKNRALMNQATYIEAGLKALHGEFDYYVEREQQLRDTNESTNARALWITILGLLITAAVTGLQHYAMRRHLRVKKILD
mgnify:FL=1